MYKYMYFYINVCVCLLEDTHRGYINIWKSKPLFLFYDDNNGNTSTELIDDYNICISVLECSIKEKRLNET